uniref:hypothetical protein n=1 Tax=Azospirillum argentinense TaxID=2970906 RepID=UPI001586E1FE|nr:hypothetical protein [Azospirillum argentinense]
MVVVGADVVRVELAPLAAVTAPIGAVLDVAGDPLQVLALTAWCRSGRRSG